MYDLAGFWTKPSSPRTLGTLCTVSSYSDTGDAILGGDRILGIGVESDRGFPVLGVATGSSPCIERAAGGKNNTSALGRLLVGNFRPLGGMARDGFFFFPFHLPCSSTFLG